MLTKTASPLAFLVLITPFGFPDLAEAESRDSNPPPVPRLETFEVESVKNEFLSRLKEYRSVAYRKESVNKEYARLVNVRNELQREDEEVESEMAALRSKYSSAAVIPKDIAHHVSLLDTQRDQLSRLIKSIDFSMNLLVEEYDVLSRLEETERGYKAKAIQKVDYISEERRLRDELFQIRIARQLDQMKWQLSEGLSRIEKKLKL